MDFLLVLGSLKEYAICFSQRAQRRREYQPPAQQVQGAGRGVDESESIAPIAASAASRMSSRRESAAARRSWPRRAAEVGERGAWAPWECRSCHGAVVFGACEILGLARNPAGCGRRQVFVVSYSYQLLFFRDE